MFLLFYFAQSESPLWHPKNTNAYHFWAVLSKDILFSCRAGQVYPVCFPLGLLSHELLCYVGFS